MRRLLIAIGIILLGAFILLGASAALFTDYLWFASLGYLTVFWRSLLAQTGVRLLALLLFATFFFVNLAFTRRSIGHALFRYRNQLPIEIGLRWILPVAGIASLLAGIIFSSALAPYWQEFLNFVYATPFDQVDPIFEKDLGFYIFRLPFLQVAYSALQGALVFTAVTVATIYLATGAIHLEGFNLRMQFAPKVHVTALLILIVGLKALGYQIGLYNLLYSPRGVVFGASYTDIHAQALALRVLTFLSLLIAVILLVNIFRRGTIFLVGSIAALLLVSLLLGNVYPNVLESLVVQPNQLEKERPFIEHNIRMTRQAYNLEQVEERNYPARTGLSLEDLQSNQETVQNIRLWDWRPLRDTYNQLQGLRPYYRFEHVDVDRYTFGDRLRQVTISARELDNSRIPSRTWINEHFIYTHGYGLVMNQVTEVTPEGLPSFLLTDIPPTPRKDVELNVNRPEIYYGELANDYCLVKTDTPEFDYPGGEENVFTTYQGNGGVPIGPLLNRIAFSLRLGTIKLLLSGNINSESRVMINRDIMARVRKIAPFLRYDPDPYIVLADGRLFWMVDAYTTSNRYPYSQPVRGWGNYVRNSVKVVVDAYNGSVDFFIYDETDPIVQTYDRIFPGLFKSRNEMSESLRRHVRYPEALFLLQASIYSVYRMTSPVVFYNQEDVWVRPKELFGEQQIDVEPYYIVMRLPDEDTAEYILMLPFTPRNRNNMIAWMAARNDGEHYGKLLVFLFPKQRQVMGPAQVEARIDQDPEISQKLTLWSQRGSQVIRGNLLVIPIGGAVLYVEPLYLQSEQSRLPELKQVITAFQDRLVMAPTLDTALGQLFGQERDQEPDQQATPESPEDLGSLIERARKLFEQANNSLRSGEFAEYGRLLSELEQVLDMLAQHTGSTNPADKGE